MKIKYDDLESKSKSTESTNQEQALQEVQKKLEDSEKIVKELKEEVMKEKEVIFFHYFCSYQFTCMFEMNSW